MAPLANTSAHSEKHVEETLNPERLERGVAIRLNGPMLRNFEPNLELLNGRVTGKAQRYSQLHVCTEMSIWTKNLRARLQERLPGWQQREQSPSNSQI
jgi:hypothetical protein